MSRRTFLEKSAVAATGAALGVPAAESLAQAGAAGPPRLKLGFDNFSIRALKWKAPEIIAYAARQKVDALLLSDLDVYGDPRDESAVKRAGALCREAGIELQVGSLSICPTSTRFDKRWGTAEEHLGLLLKVAKNAGATVARCVLGFAEDRRTPGGIEARIRDTVDVLKKVRSQAVGDGIRIAVENHAGDMQAWELKGLIEAAGSDFVGCTIDSGNATWALEDPQVTLDTLAPHIDSSGIRDSMIWEYPEGAKVQWTAMGDGLVDWKAFFARWTRSVPEKPVILEIISGFSRPFAYLQPDFWEPYEKVRTPEFARFLALARKGREIPPFKASESLSEAAYQQQELEKSLTFCRETLGLGRKH